jgi:hypothetical protein
MESFGRESTRSNAGQIKKSVAQSDDSCFSARKGRGSLLSVSCFLQSGVSYLYTPSASLSSVVGFRFHLNKTWLGNGSPKHRERETTEHQSLSTIHSRG